jgi:DNA-directed RNA polymerase specialized sigma24 family protein
VNVQERFGALVTHNLDFVWRTVRRLGVPASEADDASQQVFVIAHQKLAEIRAGSERAFLVAVATRVASRMRRTIQRREMAQQQLVNTPDLHSPFHAQGVSRVEARDLLDRVLDTMPPEIRVVFVLFELEDLAGAFRWSCGASSGTTPGGPRLMLKGPMTREPTNRRSAEEREFGGREETLGQSPLEAALLAAGREDTLSPARREQLLRSISVLVGAPLVPTADGVGPDLDSVGPPEGLQGGLGSPTELGTQGLGTQGLAVAAKTAGMEGLVVKVLGAVAVVGATVWGGVQMTSGPSPADSVTIAKSDVPSSVDTPVAESAVGVPSEAFSVHNEVESLEAESLGAEEEGPPPVKAGRGSKARAGSDSLSKELTLIDGARAALLRGEPASALRTLQAYRSQFPKGALRAEATVQRVEALIAIGDRGAATTIGESFLKGYPESPYSRRIASLLGVSRDPRVDSVRKNK